MNLLTLSTPTIRRILALQEAKEALSKKLAAIDAEIARLAGGSNRGPRKSGRPAKITTRLRGKTTIAVSPKAAKPVRASAKRGRRGEIGVKIVAALKAAGPKGARVADLAKQLGMKPQNLHVWFSTTGKRSGQTERAAKGVYRLKA